MYDSELVLEILRQTYQASQTILKRFQSVGYFETDAEVIYDVCKNHIPKLSQTIDKMIRELS